jgi:heme/copper-type cytochrome/quinol oxidase subunit 2
MYTVLIVFILFWPISGFLIYICGGFREKPNSSEQKRRWEALSEREKDVVLEKENRIFHKEHS